MSEEPVNASLGEVLDFMRTLWALDHALQSASKRMEGQMGITGPQRLVIRIVGRFPGISAGKLAQILHVHPSTLTGVLNRLEQRSILTRREDPTDRRRALFSLTSRGHTLNVPQGGTVEAAVTRALSQLPKKTLLAAEHVLQAVAAELEADRPQAEEANGAAPRRTAPAARPASRTSRPPAAKKKAPAKRAPGARTK